MRRSAKTWLAWAIALGWGALIWGLGSDGFSMSSTSRFLGPLLGWLSPDMTAEQHQLALVALRKAAHVGEYALFALLVGRAIALAFRVRMRFVVASALAAVAALAVADEVRQALSQLRTGSPFDVLLDFSGGLVALASLFALRRWLGRPMFDVSADASAGSEA